MRRSLSLVAAAVLSLASALSHADTVKINSFTNDQLIDIKAGSYSISAYSGQLSGVLDGSSFKTYCVDIYQDAYLGATYTDYTTVSGASASAFGAVKSTELDHLLSYLSTHYDTSKSLDSAVAQAAVWEVIYEVGTTYDLLHGNFTAYSGSATTEAAFASFDWNAVGSTAITLHADQLHSAKEQDFIRVTPVPEASTYAMMIGGLGALGFVARRRRPNV